MSTKIGLKCCFFVLGVSCKQTVQGVLRKDKNLEIIATEQPKKEEPKPKAKPKSGPKELRGVWMTNTGSQAFKSKNALEEALDKVVKSGFNTVFPAVWNKGYSLFPSEAVQKVTGALVFPANGLDGRDMLKEMIEHTSQTRVEVIPWFEYGLKTISDSPLATRNPSWFLLSSDGSKGFSENNFMMQFLDPTNTQVQEFYIKMVTEAVTKYEVSSVQFDDHFAIRKEFGYNPKILEAYRSKTGVTTSPSADDANWKKFRAELVTDFFRKLVGAVRRAKPGILISLSPNPYGTAYENTLQDWRTWVREGLVDNLVIQLYRDSTAAIQAEINKPEVQEAIQKIPVSIGLYSGRADKKITLTQIEEQVNLVRRAKLSGFSFFYFESVFTVSPEGTEARMKKMSLLMPGESQPP